jgi:hypothetical protein
MTIQPTDQLMIQRGTTVSRVPASEVLASPSKLLDTDLIAAERGSVTYQATVKDLRDLINGPAVAPLVCPTGEPDWWANRMDATFMAARAEAFAECTSFNSTWKDCRTMVDFPLINTSNATSFVSAWQNCVALTPFPAIDMSKGTDFSRAWQELNACTAFPVENFPAGVNFISAWQGAVKLLEFPACTFPLGQNFLSTWESCYEMVTFGPNAFPEATTLSGGWRNCVKMQNFPLFTAPKCTNFDGSWTNCTVLTPQSTENILVSLDNTGKSALKTDVGKCPRSTWSATALAAFNSLVAKGWTVLSIA